MIDEKTFPRNRISILSVEMRSTQKESSSAMLSEKIAVNSFQQYSEGGRRWTKQTGGEKLELGDVSSCPAS